MLFRQKVDTLSGGTLERRRNTRTKNDECSVCPAALYRDILMIDVFLRNRIFVRSEACLQSLFDAVERCCLSVCLIAEADNEMKGDLRNGR